MRRFDTEVRFASTVLRCFFLIIVQRLRQQGYPSLSIHGDKKQQERDWVLAEFRTGRSPIMIATDVAARGLGVLWLK